MNAAPQQGPRELAAVAHRLETEIRAHPMCLRFERTTTYFQVIYPEGDFKTHGARASFVSGGKIAALGRLLAAIEKEWMSSYPCKFEQRP